MSLLNTFCAIHCASKNKIIQRFCKCKVSFSIIAVILGC